MRLLLRDDQWEPIKDLLPGRQGDPGVTARDNRLFVEAVLWIEYTGAPSGATCPGISASGTRCTCGFTA